MKRFFWSLLTNELYHNQREVRVGRVGRVGRVVT
jgi:hypothetical protein